MTEVSHHNSDYDPVFGDYVALLKPRVMSLVVFTAFVGLMAAPVALHPVEAFSAILFIAIGAGASGSLNMWWDADIDAVMRRTKSRPIPSGRTTPDAALGLGVALSGLSVLMLGLAKLACCRLVGIYHFLLRSSLHHVAQAGHTAEYCNWWRGWCFPTFDRMGCCHWISFY